MARSIAAQLHALFAGLPRAHGVFRPLKVGPDGKGKLKGRQATELTAPTVALWEQHLVGELGLGVHPLRDDGTVRFAALDVDVYPLDHSRLVKAIGAAELPLVVCKSKSGGAHLYLFGKEDLPAKLVRQRLGDWATQLAVPKFELYPHKDQLDGPQDQGKYLNMPYFGGTRVAVGAKGKELSVEKFLAATRAAAVTLAQLRALEGSPEDALVDGPPCLQSLAAAGPVTEYRNQTLINLAVYARQRWPDGWEGKTEDLNRKFFAQPLDSAEVLTVLKSVSKKSYNFTCKQEPIVSRCNSPVCVGRRFGVRAQAKTNGQEVGFDLNLGPLHKLLTDPPLWEWEVDGKMLRMDTDQLMTYRFFAKLCVERLNKVPAKLTQDSWNEILKEKLSSVTEEVAPTDAGTAGGLRFHLEMYCVRHQAARLEELKDGKAWWHDGLIWFRLPYFKDYLAKQRVSVSDQAILKTFRSWNFGKDQKNVRGACVQYWEMPAFERQTEPDDVPRPGKNLDGRM